MSLQQFIDDYRRANPHDVVEVKEEVSVEYEPTCYANELSTKNPLLLFDRVSGYEGIRLVNNVFGKRERIAFSLGCNEDRLYDRWNEVMNYKKSVHVSSADGQVREIVQRADALDIFKLPAPKHYREDGGRYISGGLVAARNPSNLDVVNLSYARIQLLERNRVAISMHSRGHLWNYYLLSKKAGRPLPISIIIGAHPVYYLAAAARIEDEYSKVGAVINPRLIDGIQNDIPVPGDAEIVFEGEISPGETFHEGPFSEYTGYLSNRSTNNLVHLKSLSMRSNPMFLDINPSNSKEHVLLSSVAKEGPIIQGIKQFMPPNQYELNWPTAACHYMAIGSIKRPEPGLAKQLALILLGLDHYLKIVIINEGNGLSGFGDLMKRLAQSSDKAARIDIIPQVFCNRLDPSATQEGTSSKVIIVVGDRDNATGGTDRALVLSHTFRDDGGVDIVLDDDIDVSNEDEVVWALSTRLQPAEGIKVANDKVIIDARRPKLLRPSLPEEVVRRVQARIRSSGAAS